MVPRKVLVKRLNFNALQKQLLKKWQANTTPEECLLAAQLTLFWNQEQSVNLYKFKAANPVFYRTTENSFVTALVLDLSQSLV